MGKLKYLFNEIRQQLWYKASVFSIIAILTALISIVIDRLLPYPFAFTFGIRSIDSILSILATSMLAVTIFSVSTMVSAHNAVANMSTPRVTKLLLESSKTQRAISTFIGVFIFSLLSIIILKMGIYGTTGRIILLIVTLFVIFAIIITLLDWINYLSSIGRTDQILDLVERKTIECIQSYYKGPLQKATLIQDKNDVPKQYFKIASDTTGYIRYLDIDRLEKIARELGEDCKFYILEMPGALVGPFTCIIATNIEIEDPKEIQNCFLISHQRDYKQDPRYGFVLFSEIGVRALSPSLNDYGTAINLFGPILRAMKLFEDLRLKPKEDLKYNHLYIPDLSPQDLFDDFFAPVLRASCNSAEVSIRLLKTLEILYKSQNKEISTLAKTYAKEIHDNSGQHLLPIDIERVHKIYLAFDD